MYTGIRVRSASRSLASSTSRRRRASFCAAIQRFTARSDSRFARLTSPWLTYPSETSCDTRSSMRCRASTDAAPSRKRCSMKSIFDMARDLASCSSSFSNEDPRNGPPAFRTSRPLCPGNVTFPTPLKRLENTSFMAIGSSVGRLSSFSRTSPFSSESLLSSSIDSDSCCAPAALSGGAAAAAEAGLVAAQAAAIARGALATSARISSAPANSGCSSTIAGRVLTKAATADLASATVIVRGSSTLLQAVRRSPRASVKRSNMLSASRALAQPGRSRSALNPSCNTCRAASSRVKGVGIAVVARRTTTSTHLEASQFGKSTYPLGLNRLFIPGFRASIECISSLYPARTTTVLPL
mmetsp:Transcript_26216/g.68868  ORF Transcript_26216/g.68868 Transcript_26216/m.68868 type:complete len:354 (-) Transcript_26216:534-1595(-)